VEIAEVITPYKVPLKESVTSCWREEEMWNRLMTQRHNSSRSFEKGKALSLTVCLLVFFCSCASTKGPEQRAFTSPEEAVDALVGAVKSENKSELLAIFGPDSEELVSSGDVVADTSRRALFVEAFEEKNRIEKEKDSAVLYVGKDDWPLPIPIVAKEDQWGFDTEAGKDEILSRRIGRNELDVIDVARAYIDAQREYASKDRDGDGVAEYAQKLRSNEGKRNGLSWETTGGEELSPLGPLFAEAVEEGYQPREKGAKPQPYHGYFFKILTRQGEDAIGGEFDYIMHGNMLFGFGLMAYPAGYGSSGIMTFIVNHQGRVYEKDLGKRTEKIANRKAEYDPDPSWNLVE
jgi:hypothetical protein